MGLRSQLSLITDEISQDFEHVVKIAKTYNIKAVEVRGVWGKNISLFSDEDIKRMKKILQKYDMKISVVSGPFAKCLLPGSRFDIFKKKKNSTLNPHYNLSLFDRLMEITDELNCSMMRIFNFFTFGSKAHSQKAWDTMINTLRPFVKRAEEQGKILVLENEHVTFADNVENCLKIIKQINSSSLKLNLDPGNFYSAREGTDPNTYQVLYDEDVVGHMHIKDAIKKIPIVGSLFGVVGEGRINYRALLEQAVNNNYQGFFALETHCLKNKEEISLKSLEYLANLLDDLEKK